jgi:hypothetical protein
MLLASNKQHKEITKNRKTQQDRQNTQKSNICLFYKQIKLLVWADDLQMHHLKGYGDILNYHMRVPLLKDVVQSMDRAMATLKGVSLFLNFQPLGASYCLERKNSTEKFI